MCAFEAVIQARSVAQSQLSHAAITLTQTPRLWTFIYTHHLHSYSATEMINLKMSGVV